MTRYNPTEFPPRGFTERQVFIYDLQELLIGEAGEKDGKQFAVHPPPSNWRPPSIRQKSGGIFLTFQEVVFYEARSS